MSTLGFRQLTCCYLLTMLHDCLSVFFALAETELIFTDLLQDE